MLNGGFATMMNLNIRCIEIGEDNGREKETSDEP